MFAQLFQFYHTGQECETPMESLSTKWHKRRMLCGKFAFFFNRRRILVTVQKIEQEITNLRRLMIGDPLSKFWCILNIFFFNDETARFRFERRIYYGKC